jgi:quercetin dioxygenase-like cupin family protein
MTAFVLAPREGRSVWLGGIGVDFKLAGKQTGGAFAIVEHPIEPGRLVPPHVHAREDEFSYVIVGEIGARIGDEVVQATTGCYVLKPRGVLHTFWNASSRPARLLEIISPAGFEQFFAELAPLFQDGPDPEQMGQLGARYGLSFHMDWVPELTARYNLKLVGQ